MSEQKPKTETAIPYSNIAFDTTMKVQMDSLTLNNVRLEKENKELAEENKNLKKQMDIANATIETDLKANLKVEIMCKSDFKDKDLEPLTIEQLQGMNATLSRTKGGDRAFYKPIRAGNDNQEGRTTVGSLYGKSREEILKMGGNF